LFFKNLLFQDNVAKKVDHKDNNDDEQCFMDGVQTASREEEQRKVV
jgi:hypothetical protein